MRTVHKFPLTGHSKQTIKMPDFSEIIHVAVQDDALYLWATVDTEEPLEDRTFVIVGTGYQIPDNVSTYSHVGTYLAGYFVGHIFEVPGQHFREPHPTDEKKA